MMNWFDLVRQAQGGAGFDNLARQFGLDPDQVQRAVAAVLPAFALGLQRQAMNPVAMAQLFQTMTTGQYATFFESATQAFSAEGRREGQAIVDRLFGSDEVTRRVAQQAGQFSGVGTEVLNQLLPLVAAILAGGMFKVMKSQGALLGTMMSAWQNPAQGAVPNPWAGLWGTPPAAEASSTASGTQNPFEVMLAAFLGKPAAPEPAPERDAGQNPADPVEAWGQMMESGQEMQRQHLHALQAIFDTALGRAGEKR
jgi:hypothetical protein